jgi:glutaconate CoA-transferase subunit B
VIGSYGRPTVRLPGGGGAPEIAASCRETYVIVPHRPRILVEQLDFVTSFGHGTGGDHRQRLGLTARGPSLVVTDLCMLRSDAETKELTVVSLHEGVDRALVEDATGWPIRFAPRLATTPPPSGEELTVLRQLHARTDAAHATPP